MSIRNSIGAFAGRGARSSVLLERLAYSGGLTVLLLLFSSWVVSQRSNVPPPMPYLTVLALADVLALMVLAVMAFVVAPALVAATVAAERRAGTLDQLRATPLPPLGLLAGLVVGAPARLYLLGAGPLALHVFASVVGTVPLELLPASLLTLAAGGAAASLLAVGVALAPRQEAGGALLAVGVAAALGVSGLITLSFASDVEMARWAFLHPAGALNASMLSFDGLWRRMTVSQWRLERFDHTSLGSAVALSPLAGSVLYLIVLVPLARAACRKLAAPHLPLFSKPQALTLFTIAAGALILPMDPSGDWRQAAEMAPFAYGLLLLPVATVLGLMSTPTFEVWAQALRGGRRPGTWDDAAAPRNTLWLMALVFVWLLILRLGGAGFPSRFTPRELYGFGWTLATALTLPSYMLFAATRYSAPTARGAFFAGIGAHLLLQVVGISLFMWRSYGDTDQALVVQAAGLAAVVVPTWVALSQRALVRRTLSGMGAGAISRRALASLPDARPAA